MYGDGDDSALRFTTICYEDTGMGGRSGTEPYDLGDYSPFTENESIT